MAVPPTFNAWTKLNPKNTGWFVIPTAETAWAACSGIRPTIIISTIPNKEPNNTSIKTGHTIWKIFILNCVLLNFWSIISSMTSLLFMKSTFYFIPIRDDVQVIPIFNQKEFVEPPKSLLFIKQLAVYFLTNRQTVVCNHLVLPTRQYETSEH